LNPSFAHWRDVLLERVGSYVNLGQFDLHAALLRWAEQASRYLLSIGTVVIGNLFSFALNSVVVFFTLFFLFREGQAIRHTLSEFLPFDVKQTDRLFRGISETIVGNLYGSLAVGAAQGTLTGLAFWILGLSAPVLWALATALASLVPVVGSALVWAPASLVLIMTGHWMKAILLLVWGAAVVGQIDVLVRPLVVGAHVKVHTLLVFFALLGGAKAFGIIGIFVGPIILSSTLVLIDMLRSAGLSWRPASESEQLVSVPEKQIR
jgi:predicted PurR-regulated permease PerM